LGLDDREDSVQPPSLAAFCLITATYAIEQYCKRRFFMKKYFERIESAGDLLLPLREYPVREVLACYSATPNSGAFWELVEPEFYRLCPEIEERLDIPPCPAAFPRFGAAAGADGFQGGVPGGLYQCEGPGGPGLGLP
jgi:hypothetical protein